MKKIELKQMENLNGGGNTIDCTLAVGSVMLAGVSVAALGVVTGGLGWALWGVGAAGSVASMVRSC